ncbi:MAG: hypothetical protein U0516_00765 [Candidatus Saccharibacteria bacterium]
MPEKNLSLYPERPNSESDSFRQTIEILSNPAEVELSPEQKAEVTAFEHSLANCNIDVSNEVNKPPYTIGEIFKIDIQEEKLCLDYFLNAFGTSVDNPTDREAMKQALIRFQSLPKEERLTLEAIENSKNYARDMLEDNLRDLLAIGAYDRRKEPTYLRILDDPNLLIEKVDAARQLKHYYKAVERDMGILSSGDPVDTAKLLMIQLHKERINTIIAASYRDAITLIEQDRVGNVLSDEQRAILFRSLPGLAARNKDALLDDAELVDKERFARTLARIDHFINGVDKSRGYSPISQALLDLRDRYEAEQIEGQYEYEDVDPELLKKTKVNAEQLAEMFQQVLREYGLLSSSTDYDPKSSVRAEDDLWRVIIDPRASRKSLAINNLKGTVMLPQKFSRTLNQTMPAGVLPLIDHETTHVLQHENADRLGLELFNGPGSARSSLWFEAGGVVWETVAQEKLFGQQRSTNFTYLAAVEKRLEGGSMTDCAFEFLKEKMRTNPDKDPQQMVSTAVGSALRLFNNGGEWTVGTSYCSNTGPLEYAEQKILADSVPENMRYLFYVGRVNLEVLAQLHKIGWFNKEDFIVPERLPSTIVEPYVKSEILSVEE